MIGTIRKHSSWLWWIIAGLTIISFVVFMGSGPARNGNSRSASNPYGTLYGKEISADAFAQAQRGFYIYYCCLLYTSPSPRDGLLSRMPSSA